MLKRMICLGVLLTITLSSAACEEAPLDEQRAKAYDSTIADGKSEEYAHAYSSAIGSGKSRRYSRIYADKIEDGESHEYAHAFAQQKSEGMGDIYTYTYAIIYSDSILSHGYSPEHAKELADSKTRHYIDGYLIALGSDKSHEFADDYANAYGDAILDDKSPTYAKAYANAVANRTSQLWADAYAGAIENGESQDHAITYATEVLKGKSHEHAYAYAKWIEQGKSEAEARAYAKVQEIPLATAKALYEEYQSNEIAAHERLNGGFYRIAGVVHDIRGTRQNAVVELGESWGGIVCPLDSSSSETIMRMRVGDEITLMGTIGKWDTTESELHIEGCKFQ